MTACCVEHDWEAAGERRESCRRCSALRFTAPPPPRCEHRWAPLGSFANHKRQWCLVCGAVGYVVQKGKPYSRKHPLGFVEELDAVFYPQNMGGARVQCVDGQEV